LAGAQAMAPMTTPGHSLLPALQASSGGHDMHGMAQHGADPHMQPARAAADHGPAADPASTGAPVDIYLLAYRFGFEPDDIRVEVGKPYRFRMMASDITHGASLQLGRGSRMIRLRPHVVSDQTITFTRRGPVLIYCTVFCGPAHDAMTARIVVA
jgi:heme/copper-type cytochrome/quinol oxidase subunit 2